MSSPTQKTLEYERGLGCDAQVVEYWNAFARKRVDLFRCIDVVSLDKHVKGIQCTSRSNHSARMKKAQAQPEIVRWVRCGAQFFVQSWKKGSKQIRQSMAYVDDDGKLQFFDEL
jgi:hypothetical protein